MPKSSARRCTSRESTGDREEFPDLRPQLPENAESDLPKDVYQIDNGRSIRVLGLKYRSLRECVVDTVKSLKTVGA